MRKLIICFFLLISTSAIAQEMIFCEKVDDTGTEINPATIFFIDKKGGFLNVLIRSLTAVVSSEVVYDVYLIDPKSNKEIFNSSIRMKINPGINWFFKEITFYKAGNYHIYVYDEKDRLISVGKVAVAFR